LWGKPEDRWSQEAKGVHNVGRRYKRFGAGGGGEKDRGIKRPILSKIL